jgi:pyrroline-5-carboxylate reductase
MAHIDKRVAVVGAGNMGGALIAGLVQSGLLAADRVTAVDVSDALLSRHRETLGVATAGALDSALAEQDVIVLGVKPQVWTSAAASWIGRVTPAQLVLSIMGGVTTVSIEARLADGVGVVRAMPNILCQVNAAVSALCGGKHATEDDLETAAAILGSVGETVRVAEWQMDAVTGLSGSGPAYVFTVIDALADGGVKEGLAKADALKLAAQTVLGAAKMVLDGGAHPAVLKDRVTSPGGTTIAGLHALEQAGLRAALMNAVQAAARRSRELGRGE